jgi:hypothetical protein
MSHGSMNGYVLATLPKQTAGIRLSTMHLIDRGIVVRRGKKVSDKYRKEFLEAARQYLFGLLSAKSVAIGM